MNDVSTNLLVQMRAMARDANGLDSGIDAAGGAEAASGTEFGTVFKEMVDEVNDAQMRSKAVAKDFSMEREGVGLADAVLAMQEARLHFQSMVQIRNHLIKAYEEIMRMPV